MKTNYNCSVEATLEVLGGKWKTLILYHLTDQTLRYNSIKKLIPNISYKVLTAQLKQLEQDGLIQRVEYEQVPPKVEYSLSEYGESLKPVLSSMCKWGFNHIQDLGINSSK
ncbi:winged helix-turn-helix transcriptional regulator [Paenibacillus sp. GCM10027628]|uniref:winged helix-turn-helix transcriptional regulator n=1 Tax=Paenibacillus sp. GCM10027628 TaxID=3273413 RepID=UPI00364472D9